MLLTKLLQKDYTKNSDGYQLKLPLNLETIIPDNDSVRLLSQFVEAMDLTDLYSTYERINSVSPRTLLKIVLYSYMNGDYSSRSMEVNYSVTELPEHLNRGGIPPFSGCVHDTTTVYSFELYSYFYDFRCFQSGHGQFFFYSGYGEIFSQDIICADSIRIIILLSISV